MGRERKAPPLFEIGKERRYDGKPQREPQHQTARTNQNRDQANQTHRTTSSSQNSATNEHKHPNQYTKGADDEGGKNSTRNSARNSR